MGNHVLLVRYAYFRVRSYQWDCFVLNSVALLHRERAEVGDCFSRLEVRKDSFFKFTWWCYCSRIYYVGRISVSFPFNDARGWERMGKSHLTVVCVSVIHDNQVGICEAVYWEALRILEL